MTRPFACQWLVVCLAGLCIQSAPGERYAFRIVAERGVDVPYIQGLPPVITGNVRVEIHDDGSQSGSHPGSVSARYYKVEEQMP